MTKFYVTFTRISRLRNHYVEIQAYTIREATSVANNLFKNVDMVWYPDKFTHRLMFPRGCFAIIKSEEFVKEL